MSRVPSGHAGGAPVPSMYYQSGVHPGAVPQGMPMQGGYVDQSYGAYRPPGPQNGAPIAHPSQGGPYGAAPDGYNAIAGPSRDAYGYRTVSAQEMRGDPRAAAAGGWQNVQHKASMKAEDIKPSLSMTHSYETPKSGGGPGSGASASGANDASAGSGGGQQPGPSEFIKKLYKMLEDESATYGRGKPAGAPRSKGERGSVGWGRGGTSFVVWDMNEFTTKVLPQTFRHSNFSSFVRQLNKYGFSKIKHVDEETGQIKENVWEFQHPNFQAGGKADLDSIKRKAVVPKKATGDERSDSPARGLTAEDAGRIIEMESRMAGLEEALFKSQEQLRDSRIRENGIMSILREVVGHLVSTDKETPSPPDGESSARVRRMYQLYEQVAQSNGVHSHPNAGFVGGAQPGSSFPYGPSAPMPYGTTLPFPGVGRFPVPPLQAQGGLPNGRGPRAGVVPPQMTAGGSGNSPSSRSQQPPQPMSTPHQQDEAKMPQQQQLYNGSPMNMTSGQFSTLQDGNTVNGVPLRKPGESTSLSFVVDGLGSQTSQLSASMAPPEEQRDMGSAGTAAVTSAAGAAAEAEVSTRQASYNPMPIPQQQQQQQQAAPSQIQANGVPGPVTRRAPPKPSWTQTPRILVVEDDLVYRQLSSKFLEKFGCVVETVADAQQGIEKMNKTKYDLVLMDIFFGPSMDGRKATSLIRQFDSYTPIISMTSNVQTKDVDSYIQSGMNDVLAKPFTKHGLFCILDKHLIHLKAIQLSGEVPRFLGVPPLSDQGVMDAITTSAAQWDANGDEIGNPLAGSGWSDEQYQLVLQQFLTTGEVPDPNVLTHTTTLIAGAGPSGQLIGSLIPNTGFAMSRKRSIEMVDDGWEDQANKRPFMQGVGVQGMPAASVSEMA